MEPENIYEWLYDRYYRPREAEILRSWQNGAPDLRAAEERLLSGGGSRPARADALNLCRQATGVTSFAAGMYLACRLLTDLDFLEG